MKKYLNNIKFLAPVLVLLLIFNACTILPAPPNSESGYGSIQVYSEPANACIYLDGINTGYKTPGLLTNIYAGSHLITLEMDGYINSNDFVQVYPYQTTPLYVRLTPNPYLPYPEKNLLMIVVRPEIIEIPIGYWAYIDSITAHYSDGSTKTLIAYQCNLSSSRPEVADIMAYGKIVALSEGQTKIWIDYSESGTTKADSILINVYKNPQRTGNLLSINVLPKEMSLNIGESKTISSITAYYDNGTNRIVSPYLCIFNIDNPIITVSNSGKIAGIAEGTSVVTVSYSEGGIIKTDTLTVEVGKASIDAPVYRSLSIGIGDYIIYGPEGDLLAPPYDVNKITSMYRDCRFGFNNDSFLKIDTLVDSQATKNNILNKIRSTFSGSKESDISYFYFSGHGALLNQTSYLCPVDFNGNVSTAISVDELQSVLSTIPGKKVVFIDCCHSGGFIGKSGSAIEVNGIESNNYLNQFNGNIISAFADRIISKGPLTSSEYQVLTSSHWFQSSYELNPPNSKPFGVFTQALYEGCSLPYNTAADLNHDDKISLHEAYQFIRQWIFSLLINQSVQVFPSNSPFTIFEY